MTFIEEQIAKIEGSDTRIVFPEGTEPNIILTAARIMELGIASPILVGRPGRIEKRAAEVEASLEGIRIVNPAESEDRARYAAIFAEESGLPEAAAEVMLKNTLYYGAMMVKAGDADCCAAGIATETDEVVAAYKLLIGMEEGVTTPSCIALQ